MDKRLRLRGIVVSTRAARTSHPGDLERIRTSSHALLAQLVSDVINDGADPDLIRDIEAARRDLWT